MCPGERYFDEITVRRCVLVCVPVRECEMINASLGCKPVEVVPRPVWKKVRAHTHTQKKKQDAKHPFSGSKITGYAAATGILVAGGRVD